MKKLVTFEIEEPEHDNERIALLIISTVFYTPVKDTLSITEAPNLRIVQRDDGRGAVIYLPDKDDPAVDVFRRTNRDKFGLYFSGHAAVSPESARIFAFALLQAVRIAEQLSEASATPAHERQSK